MRGRFNFDLISPSRSTDSAEIRRPTFAARIKKIAATQDRMEFGILLRPPPLSYHPFSLLFYSTPSDPLPGGKLSCLSPFEQQTLLIHRQTNKFGTRRLQKLRGHRSAPVDFDCEVFEQPENLVGAGGEKTNRMARKCFYFDWRGKTDRFCSFTEKDRERNIPENKQFSPSNSNLGLKG